MNMKMCGMFLNRSTEEDFSTYYFITVPSDFIEIQIETLLQQTWYLSLDQIRLSLPKITHLTMPSPIPDIEGILYLKWKKIVEITWIDRWDTVTPIYGIKVQVQLTRAALSST